MLWIFLKVFCICSSTNLYRYRVLVLGRVILITVMVFFCYTKFWYPWSVLREFKFSLFVFIKLAPMWLNLGSNHIECATQSHGVWHVIHNKPQNLVYSCYLYRHIRHQEVLMEEEPGHLKHPKNWPSNMVC